MQLRKAYQEINPTLLYDEIKELVTRAGASLDQNRLETYSMPSDSSTFVYRGTLTFKIQGKEAIRAHIIGVDRGETRLILDSDDSIIPPEKIQSIEKDLDFMLGSYESKR
ncbi:MAG: hypothetical protein NUV31_10730 [Dehalococcoidales bacterium]|jgi:hypothetical protein|nr:hypothetical protein [Dehalococcoidales bacterium]